MRWTPLSIFHIIQLDHPATIELLKHELVGRRFEGAALERIRRTQQFPKLVDLTILHGWHSPSEPDLPKSESESKSSHCNSNVEKSFYAARHIYLSIKQTGDGSGDRSEFRGRTGKNFTRETYLIRRTNKKILSNL